MGKTLAWKSKAVNLFRRRKIQVTPHVRLILPSLPSQTQFNADLRNPQRCDEVAGSTRSLTRTSWNEPVCRTRSSHLPERTTRKILTRKDTEHLLTITLTRNTIREPNTRARLVVICQRALGRDDGVVSLGGRRVSRFFTAVSASSGIGCPLANLPNHVVPAGFGSIGFVANASRQEISAPLALDVDPPRRS
jgi:hypothetical protein